MTSPAPRRRRSPAVLALGLAALAALFVTGAWLLFVHQVYEPPTVRVERAATAEPAAPPPAEEPPAEAEPEGAQVIAVVGQVERSGAPGSWSALRPGDVLRAEDAVRTGAASRADLAVGAHARITLGERTRLRVGEVSRQAQRFRLLGGRLSADVAPGGDGRLTVEDARGEATAAASSGRFAVVANGVTLAVATETGTVNLATSRGAVDVGAGEHASARAGAAPTRPAPMSAEVLLRLAGVAPGGSTDCERVRGRVEPGTIVQVNGVPAEVDAEGRFAVRPRRRPGEVLTVAVTDVAGREAERALRCEVETVDESQEADVKDLSVRWGHAKKAR